MENLEKSKRYSKINWPSEKMAEAQPQQVNRPNPLGPFHPTRKFSEPERWICIYPAYLNSNKTRQEGRLLPKEKVSWVMEFPTWSKKI